MLSSPCSKEDGSIICKWLQASCFHITVDEGTAMTGLDSPQTSNEFFCFDPLPFAHQPQVGRYGRWSNLFTVEGPILFELSPMRITFFDFSIEFDTIQHLLLSKTMGRVLVSTSMIWSQTGLSGAAEELSVREVIEQRQRELGRPCSSSWDRIKSWLTSPDTLVSTLTRHTGLEGEHGGCIQEGEEWTRFSEEALVL